MNAATTTQTPALFVGWWRPRPGFAWSRLAEGSSYDAALSALLAALASVRGGDSVVLRAGEDPNARRRPYVRGGRRLL